MSEVRDATESLLADKPDLEPELRELLVLDEREETWTFDDVPLDSGAFGEVVSRGIAEESGDGYRLADRSAVGAVLDEDHVEASSEDSPSLATAWLEKTRRRIPALDRRTLGAFAAPLVLVVLFRVVTLAAVFKKGDVVLASNDPYYYRYFVETLTAQSSGPLDLSTLSELPRAVRYGEPLMVASLWWLSELFGGSPKVVGTVLAWYPVLSAAVTAGLLWVLALRLTDSQRVAMVSVAFLAITPAHAMRTGLGFSDHHAFDYPWLVLTALALVVIANRDVRKPESWPVIGVMGAAIAGQVLAWSAGPLLLVPVGIYLAVRVVIDVREDQSPLEQNGGAIAGIAVGATLIYLVHATLGWHTSVVATTPVLLLVGAAGVVGAAELIHRKGVSAGRMLQLESIGLVLAAIFVVVLPSSLTRVLLTGLDFLLNTRGIAETLSIFSGQLGSILGPVLLLGITPVLAIPVLLWNARLAVVEAQPVWFVPTVYTAYFALLAMVQVRFAGELAPFLALFTAIGFFALAAWVDLTTLPSVLRHEPDAGHSGILAESSEGGMETDEKLTPSSRRKLLTFGGLFLATGSFGGVSTLLKHTQVTIDNEPYMAATWMRNRANELGWSYPENYVLSPWSRNRFYNYYVNGHSRSYGFAQQNYQPFVLSTTPHQWYDRLDDRIGFLVTEANEVYASETEDRIYHRLHQQFGSGAGNFRAVYVADDESVKVFRPVPGVRITGPGDRASELEVAFPVEVPGSSFTFEAEPETHHGVYETTVPYPGVVSIGDDTVQLSESDVAAGRTISQFSGDGIASWSFDEGEGPTAYDRVGGNHLRGVGSRWQSGGDRSAISVHGAEDRPWARVDGVLLDESTSLTVTFLTRGSLSAMDETYPRLVQLRSTTGMVLGVWGRMDVGDVGVRVDDATGARRRNFGIDRTSFDTWTSIAAVLDREADELRLYADGSLVRAENADGIGSLGRLARVEVGSEASASGRPALLDSLRIHDEALDDRALDGPSGGGS